MTQVKSGPGLLRFSSGNLQTRREILTNGSFGALEL